MRILHVIPAGSSDCSALALAVAQSERMESIVLAADGSDIEVAAAQAGLPVVTLRKGQTPARLNDAVQILTPDIVHLHGVLASNEAVPLRVFSNLPVVLQLAADDFDADGQVRRDVQGVRMDWRGGQAAALIRGAGCDGRVARIPYGVTEVIDASQNEMDAAWCARLYRRLIAANAAHQAGLAVSGAA
jgi:hypothetical protein